MNIYEKKEQVIEALFVQHAKTVFLGQDRKVREWYKVTENWARGAVKQIIWLLARKGQQLLPAACLLGKMGGLCALLVTADNGLDAWWSNKIRLTVSVSDMQLYPEPIQDFSSYNKNWVQASSKLC